MPIASAENSFKKGLTSLREGKPDEAAASFKAAMQIEREIGAGRPQMKYLSYYGVSFAQAYGATREALRACESAVKKDFLNATLFLNLGRVYLIAGKVTRALAAFEHGLRISPNHKELQDELAKVDRRSLPPIPFLSRCHPLNVWLGKLRARFFARSLDVKS
jgi:tetratricopeptide (TPR) repeat protein